MAEMNEPRKMTLSNLCNGAVLEVFEHDLQKVLENIQDINCDWKKARSITLQIIFKPYDENRAATQITFNSKPSLAPVNSVKGTMFLARQDGQLIGIAHDPKQGRLFELPSQAAARPADLDATAAAVKDKLSTFSASASPGGEFRNRQIAES